MNLHTHLNDQSYSSYFTLIPMVKNINFEGKWGFYMDFHYEELNLDQKYSDEDTEIEINKVPTILFEKGILP